MNNYRGKPIRTAKTKNGKTIRLMDPGEKSRKFATELKSGTKFTNFGVQKRSKNGKPMRLTDTEAAYRGGYLAARKDNARAYKHNQGKRYNSKSSKKF